MRTATWLGASITALVALVCFAAAPGPVEAANVPSVDIEIDAVMVILPSLPFFWGYPSPEAPPGFQSFIVPISS